MQSGEPLGESSLTLHIGSLESARHPVLRVLKKSKRELENWGEHQGIRGSLGSRKFTYPPWRLLPRGFHKSRNT